MKKNAYTFLSILTISFVVFWIFYAQMPAADSHLNKPLSEFSSKRALKTVAVLSQKPHYIGTKNHEQVVTYIQSELQKMGLSSQIEEGFSLTDWGNLVKSRNIVAKIPGYSSSKALLLLSHYDSAPHSKSHGASDDGVGVATILEGLRAFLHNKTGHKNDIIVLFSDAEELGLNGAAMFVSKNKWSKEIGLAINFEARGSSGPSYMLMEVNQGNAALIKQFDQANVPFPVANSLLYSIYKMLPNDTDLTVFREQGNIQGLNFAFIDDHFNYHTQQDDLKHLSTKTVAHQGSYMLPLLQYFSNSELQNLNSKDDYVYFDTPFGFVLYPFSWIFVMLIVTTILFFGLLFVGFGKRLLQMQLIAKGFLLFFGSLITSGVVAFFGWTLLKVIYPQYNDILQGFTYNGHYYIIAFVLLSLGFCFLFFSQKISENQQVNYAVTPMFLWLIINFGIAFYLPGAAFFIIPLMASLIGFAYFIVSQSVNKWLNLVVCLPTLFVFVPLVITLPVGLGLKMLVASALLVCLIFGLIIPVFTAFKLKKTWSFLFFVAAICFFIQAHLNSGYEYGKAKPNSLTYVLNAETNEAFWATYDKNLDPWTTLYLGKNPSKTNAKSLFLLNSKYNSGFNFAKKTTVLNFPKPTIEFLTDSIFGANRFLKIKISSNRKVNRYDILANENMKIVGLKANGVKAIVSKNSKFKPSSNTLLRYYLIDNQPLELQFMMPSNAVFDMDLIESSFDLLENPLLKVKKRESWMMPAPFVLNDAIIIKQKIKKTIVTVVLDSLKKEITTPKFKVDNVK